MDEATSTGALPTGIGGSVRRIVSLVGDMAETRLSLAAIELEEHRLHVSRQFVGLAWSLFLAGIATLLAGVWVVMACPPEWRTTVVGAMALAFGLAALVMGRVVHARGERQPPPLHDTLAELRRDLALLRGLGDRS